MSTTPPPDPRSGAETVPPPGVPAQQPSVADAQPREPRGVAFFVAIFLGILLVASAGLNVLLLLLSVGSLAGGGFADPANADFDEAFVAGERGGDHKVLQIAIRGAIAEGANPLMGASGGTVSSVRRALRYAEREGVEGVLLYIDSPGGGVTDSDRVYKMLRTFREERPDLPVAALYGDMCASGGYYIAVAAEHVISRRTSISGSIGVIMSAWNFAEMAKNYGVEQIAIKSARTPYKDMLSPTRPMSEGEREMLTSIVDELYDQFVAVVMEGRGLDKERVERAANGGIYTAKQALELDLVDDIGDYDTAVAWFEQRLGHEVTIVEQRRRPSFGDLLFGALSGKAEGGAVDRLLSSSTGPRFLYYWQGGR